MSLQQQDLPLPPSTRSGRASQLRAREWQPNFVAFHMLSSRSVIEVVARYTDLSNVASHQGFRDASDSGFGGFGLV